jgi:hypothetical protein
MELDRHDGPFRKDSRCDKANGRQDVNCRDRAPALPPRRETSPATSSPPRMLAGVRQRRCRRDLELQSSRLSPLRRSRSRDRVRLLDPNTARAKLALSVVLPVAGGGRLGVQATPQLSIDRRTIAEQPRTRRRYISRGVALHALEATRPEHIIRDPAGFFDQALQRSSRSLRGHGFFHHHGIRATTCLAHPSHLVNKASCFC